MLAVSFAARAGKSDKGAIANLTSHVMYRERIALQQRSIVAVKLVDVTRTHVKATLLAEQRIENPASVQIPFKP